MERLPPNQHIAKKMPVQHFGKVPEFNKNTWDFRVVGLVEKPLRLTYDEFLALEKTTYVSDFHCVMGWSRLDNKREGVRFCDVAAIVKLKRKCPVCDHRSRRRIYDKPITFRADGA